MKEPAPNPTQKAARVLADDRLADDLGRHFTPQQRDGGDLVRKFAGRDGPLYGARVAIAIYTVVALIGIALNGWGGWRRHSFGAAEVPHDDDTPEDRHRFLGSATVLLAALSAIAVLFAALVIVFFKDCR